MKILAIETSCDETAAAVVVDGATIVSLGGEQPGRPARPLRRGRARGRQPGPCRAAQPGVAEAMDEAGVGRAGPSLDAVAATIGPGLIGSLLVGVSAAKAYALAWGVPFVGVNHLEAHLHAAFLEEPDLELPAGRPAGVGWPHHADRDATSPGPRTAAPRAADHRRRRRRGLRQGRPVPRPRLPRRSGDRAGGRPGDPTAVAFPRALRGDGLRLLLQRAEDRR